MVEDPTLILVVEDNPANRELLVEYLEAERFDVVEAGDARSGFELFKVRRPDLVLLDVMLPDDSGFNLCRRMKSISRKFVPVVLVTALHETADKVQGLGAGADDFLSKPIIREELVARTRSHLRVKRMVDKVEMYQAELARFNQRLQEEVDLRTRQLQGALADLKRAKELTELTQQEIIERLGVASEYRDQETGNHVRRMSQLVHELALAFGLSPATAELFRQAAALHDIGKIGVRDHVLLKPEQLDEGEAELIREHTIIGASILANPRTELLHVACQMARSHHERWDGLGYPDGLKGDEIPLPARLCTVADVFDAITTRRVYRREPMSPQDARNDILQGSGTRFDPAVVAAFDLCFARVVQSREAVEP
jgi:putative two-component system response regulator